MHRQRDKRSRIWARSSLQALSLATSILVDGCATLGTEGPHAAAAAPPILHREDTQWLGRVAFGLDSETVADYHRLGRERFLDYQLHPRDAALQAPIAAEIAALEVSHADPAQ